MATDWNAFTDKAEAQCTRYSAKELKICLLMLDPDALLHYSLFLRLLARLGIDRFQWGRTVLYQGLFRKVLKRNPGLFRNAPTKAQIAYNNLIRSLFPSFVAKELTVALLPQEVSVTPFREQLGYDKRLAYFLDQSKQFADLQSDANFLPKIYPDFNPENIEEPLLKLEKKLDERTSRLKDITQKKMDLLRVAAMLPIEPPSFLKVQKPEEWQKIFSDLALFQASVVNEVGLFADEKAFLDWAKEQDEKLDFAKRRAQPLLLAQSLDKPVREFVESLKPILPFLYEVYVLGFVATLEDDILKTEDANRSKQEILGQINRQRSQVEHLDHEVKAASEAFKKGSIHYFPQLVAPELVAYKDLPKEAEKLVSEHFLPEKKTDVRLTDDAMQAFREELRGYYDNQLQKIANLLKTGKNRSAKLEEMELFRKDYLKVVARIKFFKDLQLEFPHLGDAPTISKQDLSRPSVQEVEELLHERYAEELKLKEKLPQINEQLNARAALSEQRCQDAKLAIKRRLFEIFWNITPYLDLTENLSDLRKELSTRLGHLVEDFYQGKLSSSEFFSASEELAYEHDVVKIRNEVMHRSSRLKDLRDELFRMRGLVSDYRRFLEMTGNQQERVYLEFFNLQSILKKISSDVENPFQAFQAAKSKDDINYVFRNFWIRIEEVQPRVNQALEQAKIILTSSVMSLKSRFLKTLDTVEETISLKDGVRPPLVTQAERELSNVVHADLFHAILSQIHAIEKRYSYVQPFSFFMNVSDLADRQSMFQEARELEDQIIRTHDFAKQMQYIKTFEEERVDVILEAFEKQHLMEDENELGSHLKEVWIKHVEHVRRSSSAVEEEVFLDIGLLDRHALMDVDPDHLRSILKLSLQEARLYIGSSSYSVFGRVEKLPAPIPSYPLCQAVINDLAVDIKEWSEISLPQGADIDELLNHLRRFCHFLFAAKIRLAAHEGMLLPKCLNIVQELRSAVRAVEAWLIVKRLERGTPWGKPWIQEAYSMRSDIESFETHDEKAIAYKQLVERIFASLSKLPEAAELQGQEGLNLTLMHQELEAHLQEIDKLAKFPKREHPFIYIPGYLAFFDLYL